MTDVLRTFPISTPDVDKLRILVHGPVGAGKSSFINSIDSIFQDHMTSGAIAEACAGHSFTKIYKIFRIKDGGYKSYLPFVFSDVMGLERGDQEGVQTKDLKTILEGHVKEGHMFIKTHKINDGGYESFSPFVFNDVMGLEKGDSEGVQTDDLIQIMEGHIKEDYMVQACHHGFGFPMSIFPVKNYHEERQLNPDVDAVLLFTLKQIVDSANDFVEEMREPETANSHKRSSKEFAPDFEGEGKKQ